MSLVVVSLAVVICIVGVVVVRAISTVEQRLAIATNLLEELTRLKEIHQRLAGLESDVNRIRSAVSPSRAVYAEPHHATVKQMIGIPDKKKNDLYDRAMTIDIDGRGLDQFESELPVRRSMS